ncbi:hypothetical protein VFPFJ_07901 [Purpureocillium lilacinum]|uniref:Uncharacterized protein n=1 Tax=Purpureocillium lilacinum TaxID=33203 RepID=A0A179H6F1_PURLI|nr:hypothetical protein VFPFJ_07901 [Purpureocillium lilacinum]OAQ85512.1 hypothetical protein VFPFJ_07901 [Purpureocillium lilacinum]
MHDSRRRTQAPLGLLRQVRQLFPALLSCGPSSKCPHRQCQGKHPLPGVMTTTHLSHQIVASGSSIVSAGPAQRRSGRMENRGPGIWNEVWVSWWRRHTDDICPALPGSFVPSSPPMPPRACTHVGQRNLAQRRRARTSGAWVVQQRS